MLRVNLPNDADIEQMGERVFDVLENVGAMFQNEEMLRALEAVGAKVDYGAETARFPRKLQAEFVESARRERREAKARGREARFEGAPLANLETQVAQFVYDFDREERRPGSRADLIEMTKLGDVLHGEAGVGHSVLVRDVPPIVEPLEAALVLGEYARKPGFVFAWNVRQADYLVEMGEILGVDDWLTLGAVCIAHPLRFDRAVADRYLQMLKWGHTAGLTAMPVAGLTTPITVEGFIVVASAELLASWIAGRAVNPEVSLGGSMWAGTPDMRTGHVSFSNFDAMFYAIAAVQFLEEWCGVRVVVGGGEYCDAKRPGLYAALEKAHKAMTIAAFTGQHPAIGQGMLDVGKVLSDVQLLLERDLGLGLNHYARPIEPSEENIALSTVEEVGIGLGANYLQSEHTALNFRRSLWLPELLDRTGWDGFEKEKQILARAREKSRSLTEGYVKPEGREEKLAAMRAVVERAKADLAE
jgi:trimethylamine:corrinoid methyltransferase-like protein